MDRYSGDFDSGHGPDRDCGHGPVLYSGDSDCSHGSEFRLWSWTSIQVVLIVVVD